MGKNTFRIFLALAVPVILSLILFGCSAYAPESSGSKNNDIENGDTNGYGGTSGQTASNAAEKADSGRKVIFTAALQVETLDYDKSIADFEQLVAEKEGYIQDSRVETNAGINGADTLRSAVYTVRIPSARLHEFRKAAGGIGTVIVDEVSGEDVTDQYVDAQARLETLKVQETRLLKLLEESGSLADMLEIEDRLAEVRYQIETLTGSLTKLDSLVAMSTVTVSIDEVKALTEPTPADFFSQVASVFSKSVKALVSTLRALSLVIVAIAPFVVVFGGTVAVILLIAVFSSRKRKARAAAAAGRHDDPQGQGK